MSEVFKRKLPNGLTVILKEDHRLPLACVLTWVNVGYFNEPDDLTGVSHYIEHLFFKGTPKRGVGVIAKETKEIGGYLNASTIYDYTYYYTVVPAQSVVQAIDIQSDALIHPLFDSGEMKKEKEVIIQELKRKYDNPDSYAWEKLTAQTFDRHRIRRWRMGTEDQIRNYSREAVMAFYERYYRPSNITVVIVGDFKQEEVFREVEAKYGEMKAGAVDREESPSEGETFKSPRFSRMTGDISQPMVKIGFQAPSISHSDYAPMHVLNLILGRGRSSRLYRSLKEEKRLVDGVGSSFYSTRDVGFFTVEMELKHENLPQAEEEIWGEFDRILRDPPSQAEVDRVRNVLEANFFAEREEILGQAYSLAYFDALGGYDLELEHIENLRKVTSKDIVRVLEKYISFNKMSLIEYVPTSLGDGAPPEQRLDSLKKRVVSRVEKAGPQGILEPMNPPPPLQAWNGALDPIKQGASVSTLPNGITLIHLENRALPLVSVAAYFPGGRLDETEQNCGITQFLLGNALKGTETRSSDEIAFQMESLGSSLRVEANADQFGFSTQLLTRNLEKGFELLSDVILNPIFPDREMEIERSTTLAYLRRVKDDNFKYPIELFYKALYGLHPYGLPRAGTEQTVSSFDKGQLQEWYTQIFQWKKMVISVVGDISKEKAEELVGKYFAVEKDEKEDSRAQIYPILPDRGAREIVEEKERKQTAFVVGFSGMPIKDSRYVALEVFRNIWSGMGGKFFMELREKHALAYTVAAFNIGLNRGGAFFVYMATSPEKEEEAKNRLFAQLENARTSVPTPSEVKAAKAYTLGAHSMSLQGNQSLAYALIDHHLSGRGVELIHQYPELVENITASDISRVASEVLDLDQCAWGVVRGTKS